uniref:Serine/threonine-protein phosphatase 4 regulatory subunit 3 n=3 Tax=Schistocephalus solidus TaxID=70667 RepID=A0A0X3NQB8_SCHSO
MSTSEANTRRRVKLYMLNEERQWDDKGTGHVSALYTEQNNIALVVISETDGSCLLESKIQSDTAYQKQQETLIVWSEGDNMDLALSFQEKAGCDDIWEKICRVQGKDPSVEITQDVVDESDDADDVESYTPNTSQSLQTFELPPCELSRLEEIAELVGQPQGILQKRERIVAILERTNYLRQLVDLFHKAEDLEDIESLHHLYEIFRQLILFNKQNLYEILFSDELIMEVIGILEYSPSGRTRHREFLKNQAKFKEVLPLHNPELVNKIHQTYRVQYIQDCCLPPPCLFDDQTMHVLKSFITLNKIEIISALQDDEEFMLQLFNRLKSPSTSEAYRRELALFVKEFCNLSVQTDQKDNFLNCLFSHGALSTVEVLLMFDDRDVKAAALEILHAFVENQPSVVREYVYKDNHHLPDDNRILINLMITQLLNDSDPELSDAFLLGYMLRMLIDPDNMNNTGGRSEKTEFLSFFYKRCIGTLAKPLFDNTVHEKPLHDDYHTALVLSNVLELLTFCIENHAYHMKNYCLHRDVVKRVLTLLSSHHKFLVLGALRLLRRVVNLKEEFYNRYLVKNNLFKPVVELFISNGHRYNMIDSAIIELFDYIRAENINLLITHVVEKHWDSLKGVTYVQTFTGLKELYDTLHRPNRTDSPLVFGQQGSINVFPLRTATNTRFHRTTAEFDDEEEQWFGQDDDDDEEESSPTGILTQAGVTADSQSGGGGGLLSTPLGTSMDSLVYCRAPMLSMTASLSSPPSSFDRTAALTGDDEKLEKKSPERAPPVHGPIPLHERINPERIDSPHPLRHSLLRQSAPISIHIKSTVLNGNACPDAANKTAATIIESSGVEPDNDVNSKGSKSKDLSSPDEDVEVDNGQEEEGRDGEDSKNKLTDSASSRLVRHVAKRARMLPNKHGKRPAFIAAKGSNETAIDNDALEPTAAAEKVDGIVGLVDYSDEESDDDTEDSEPENAEGTASSDTATISSLPAISDVTKCDTTEGAPVADSQQPEAKSPSASTLAAEVETS